MSIHPKTKNKKGPDVGRKQPSEKPQEEHTWRLLNAVSIKSNTLKGKYQKETEGYEKQV